MVNPSIALALYIPTLTFCLTGRERQQTRHWCNSFGGDMASTWVSKL